MKRALLIGGVGLLCLLAAGCMTNLKNQGEVGFRYGTEITFFHRSVPTNEPATAELAVPAVTEWIFGKTGTESDGTGTSGDAAKPETAADGGT